MKTQATMYGNICLDKSPATDGTNKGQPITFEIWKVYNGSFFPGHNSRDRMFIGNFRSIQEAQHELHSLFLKWLEDDRYSAGNSFWLENYQAARSKPETWVKQCRTCFRYDNYKICIVTSNRDFV